ncbi:hypothetical protein F4777DRAFT_184440 [Nemania sp. FL0916]|nr:hypothetical protein F4777DRAFT_184440 [Nemania sp. FL0916]
MPTCIPHTRAPLLIPPCVAASLPPAGSHQSLLSLSRIDKGYKVNCLPFDVLLLRPTVHCTGIYGVCRGSSTHLLIQETPTVQICMGSNRASRKVSLPPPRPI